MLEPSTTPWEEPLPGLPGAVYKGRGPGGYVAGGSVRHILGGITGIEPVLAALAVLAAVAAGAEPAGGPSTPAPISLELAARAAGAGLVVPPGAAEGLDALAGRGGPITVTPYGIFQRDAEGRGVGGAIDLDALVAGGGGAGGMGGDARSRGRRQVGEGKQLLKAHKWIETAVLVHIPKTGGTSIENWGIEHGLFQGAQLMAHHKPMPWHEHREFPWCDWAVWNSSCCSWWHLPPKYFDDFDPATPVLAAVRDPVQRAISEVKYRHMFDKKGDSRQWCHNTTFDTKITSMLSKYDENHYLSDCHWIPQIEYVTGRDGKLLPNIVLLNQPKLSRYMSGLSSGKLANHDMASPMCDNVVLAPATLELIHKHYSNDYKIADMYTKSPVHRKRHVEMHADIF